MPRSKIDERVVSEAARLLGAAAAALQGRAPNGSKPDSSSAHYGQRPLSGTCWSVREELHALKDTYEMNP
jgi:hypothetical protein